MSRVGRALAVGSLAFACGADLPGPQQTVESYLRALARDPLRTLPLLTDAFHRRHGLRFENAVETSHFEPGDLSTPESPAPDAPDAELELERARLGWLLALSRPTFGNVLPSVLLRWGSVRGSASRARVGLTVQHTRAPPLAFAFILTRDGPGTPWRIDAIEARHADSEEARLTRFLVAPDVDGARWIRELERRAQASTTAMPMRP